MHNEQRVSFLSRDMLDQFHIKFSSTLAGSKWRRTGELIYEIVTGPHRYNVRYQRVGRVNVNYDYPGGVTEIGVTHLAAEYRLNL